MTASPAKLMIYSADFWPVVGGVQSVIMTLARGFAAPECARAIECMVVTETSAGSASDSNLPFQVVRKPSLLQLARLLWKSDLVHLAGPALRPLLLSRILRKKVVVEHHGFQALCPNGLLFHEPTRTACPGRFLAGLHRECWKCNAASGRWRSLTLWVLTFFRRWSCQLVAANIAPTRRLDQWLRLPRTVVIPHGIPDRPVVPFPRVTPPTFAFIGRLVSTKGVELLLQASRELLNAGLEFRLVLIGDGPERANLEFLSRELGLAQRVEFVGQVAERNVEVLLNDVIAVVIPSVAGEVFGLVAAENMMRGRAIIAPEGGSLAEVAHDAGLKFEAGDANSLAACMERLLRFPEIASDLGERGRLRSLSKFRAEQMRDAHLLLYQEILK